MVSEKPGEKQHTSCACFSEDWVAPNHPRHPGLNCHWQDPVFAGRRLLDI